MTKKLYLYNNICYDECPNGSIKDDDINICKEINEYTTVNESISKISIKNNYIELFKNYIATSANKTLEITRTPELSNYFYNLSNKLLDDNDTPVFNKSYLKSIKMPIIDITECLIRLKLQYNLKNTDDIFMGIIEYNDNLDKYGNLNNNNTKNITDYTLFYMNGTNEVILDKSYCHDLNATVEKFYNINGHPDIQTINYIKQTYNISFPEDKEKFLEPCQKFKDENNNILTRRKRKLLIDKYINPCDDNCKFISLDISSNYTKCICPIKDEKDQALENKIEEEINGTEFVKILLEFMEVSNIEYLKCYKNLNNTSEDIKYNIIYYPSLFSIIFNFVLILYIVRKKSITEISKIYVNSIRRNLIIQNMNINNNNIDNIINEDNDEYEIEGNFERAKATNENHFWIYFIYFRNKIILVNMFFGKKKNVFYPIWLRLLLLLLFLHIYYWITVLLYNEEYIYEIKSFSKELKYILVKEWKRLLLVFIASIFLYNIILYIFFENENAFKEANKNLKKNNFTLNCYCKKIKSLKNKFKILFIIGIVFINIFYSFILLFTIIFGNFLEINLKYIFVYLILGICQYLIFYSVMFVLITVLRWLSIKTNFKPLFIISNWIAEKL